ncbi:hypothetical protein PM082_008917 [Marasmius tenuissimus]|nr:hypothetical protein PM082_008917 [Marasmius tenuissimus]
MHPRMLSFSTLSSSAAYRLPPTAYRLPPTTAPPGANSVQTTNRIEYSTLVK